MRVALLIFCCGIALAADFPIFDPDLPFLPDRPETPIFPADVFPDPIFSDGFESGDTGAWTFRTWFVWNLGRASISPGEMAVENPAGVYAVRVTVSNASGSQSAEIPVVLSVEGCLFVPALELAAYSSPVQFSAEGVGGKPPLFYRWEVVQSDIEIESLPCP